MLVSSALATYAIKKEPLGVNKALAAAPQRLTVRTGEQSLALLGREPIADSDSDPAHSLPSSNSSGQFWTEQARIGSLKCNLSDGS
jgi:hypothetical protein